MIKLNNLKKYYNYKKSNELCVVDDMTLELPSKGMIAFFGRSGCGKTSLLNLIGGLDDYQGGEISINGQSINKSNKESIRNAHIGYIFQNYNLEQNKTVAENVSVALTLMGVTDSEIIKERVTCALKSVDLERYAKRLPSTLSGGQQQRVAIARAIVKAPDIILADEPTGNLDEANTLLIMEILRKLAETKLILLVTHEEELVSNYCDRVIKLVDGKIIEDESNTLTGQGNIIDKRTLFLGDLEKGELKKDSLHLEFYGEENVEGSLKIIRKDGKIFVYSESTTVKFLDSSSELKISKNKAIVHKNENSTQLDLQALTTIDYKKGKLFTFKQSFAQGYDNNFRTSRFTKKSLIGLLALFALVTVIMTSLLTATVRTFLGRDAVTEKELLTVKINTQEELNAFYNIYNNDTNFKSISYSIDYRYYYQNDISQSKYMSLSFYTAGLSGEGDSIRGIMVNKDIIKDKYLVGREVQNDKEVVISKKIAQEFLSTPSYNFLSSINQLVGLNLTLQRELTTKIVGIVDDNRDFCFVNQNVLDNLYYKECFRELSSQESIKESYSKPIPSGYVVVNSNMNTSLKEGNTITLCNETFIVQEAVPLSNSGMYSTVYIMNDQDYNTKLKLALPPLRNEALAITVYCDDPIAGKNSLSGKFSVLDDNAFRAMYSKMPKYEVVFLSITVSIIIAVMLLCIGLIMRASLMSRIKEIGVLRAIGASKRDVIKNFAVETFAVMCWTILIGLVLGIAFVWIVTAALPILKGVIYLPVWVAVVLTAVIGLASMLCGLIPVFKILRRTPADILAKYDV